MAVLQGYLRLHHGTPLDAAAIAGMVEATERLAAVSQQLSALTTFLTRSPAVPAPPTSVNDFVAALRQTPHDVQDTAGHSRAGLRTLRAPQPVISAIGALATAVAKESEVGSAQIMIACEAAAVTCTISAAPPQSTLPASFAMSPLPVPWHLLGGHGLGLVVAAVVFDSMGISIVWSHRGTPALVSLPLGVPL